MELGKKAFAWAKAELETSGCELVERKMTNPREFFIRDDSHTSFFHEEGQPYALCRTYWYDGHLAYYRVTNYDELLRESPDLINLLLKSGEYIYQKAAAKTGTTKVMSFEFFR
ncbi:MAG: hypothetical protein ACK5MU_03870 [Candidatus Saccharimonadales bacterium]